MDIKIEYDGSYPNLCRGNLVVIIDGSRWDFPDCCLYSNGGINPNYEGTYKGPWEINGDDWPEDFPEELKGLVTKAINEQIPLGCCGGCI